MKSVGTHSKLPGVLISVEGGEGVGKSVFCRSLTEVLNLNGLKPLASFEPGGTPTANAIRSLFLNPAADDPLVAEAELFLVSAARVQHIKRLLLPALKQGRWIVCDRYFDSTRVYQGILPDLDETFVEEIIKLSVQGVEPMITFLLDCDVGTALKRLNKRAQNNEDHSRFDAAHVGFHERLRQGYLTVAKRYPERIHVLNASLPPGQVLEQAFAILKERTGKAFAKKI